jgi:hypothetical protein
VDVEAALGVGRVDGAGVGDGGGLGDNVMVGAQPATATARMIASVRADGLALIVPK